MMDQKDIMSTEGIDPRAFSEDGYLKDQDFTEGLKYGYWPSSYNGCGWIAVYNALHAAGLKSVPEKVFQEMLDILPFEGRRGTPFRTVAQYYRERKLPHRLYYGRRGLMNRLAADESVQIGILRYGEGFKRVIPHYTVFVRAEGDRFRFFNSDDGQEDITVPMAQFVREHMNPRFWARVLVPGEGAGRGKKAKEAGASGAG